jgi:hypothetical protein
MCRLPSYGFSFDKLHASNDVWHVGEELTPLLNGVFDGMSPGHYRQHRVEKCCELLRLLKLTYVARDDSVEAAAFRRSKVDEPVRRTFPSERGVEDSYVFVLNSLVDGLHIEDWRWEILVK